MALVEPPGAFDPATFRERVLDLGLDPAVHLLLLTPAGTMERRGHERRDHRGIFGGIGVARLILNDFRRTRSPHGSYRRYAAARYCPDAPGAQRHHYRRRA